MKPVLWTNQILFHDLTILYGLRQQRRLAPAPYSPQHFTVCASIIAPPPPLYSTLQYPAVRSNLRAAAHRLGWSSRRSDNNHANWTPHGRNELRALANIAFIATAVRFRFPSSASGMRRRRFDTTAA